MEKKLKGIKKFFAEFKTFITRGNVLDMAVGVIVGGAFTGIVNGLSNFILKPIINWLIALIIGKNGLEGAVTILGDPALLEDGTIDLANSIYIDWGAFISSIINFLLIAFTLFTIVRIMNNVAKARERALLELEQEVNEKKAIKKIRKEQNIGRKEALALYEAKVEAAKAAKAEEERIAAEKAAADEAAAKAAEEEKAMANTKLLAEIRDLLKNKA